MKEKEPIQTQSHSEKEIYEACIDLMNNLVDEFRDYLDFLDIDVSSLSEEEQFCLNMPPTEIVRKLFLSHTSHSGGASTRAKCNELGIDTDKWVQFSFPEYKNMQEEKEDLE